MKNKTTNDPKVILRFESESQVTIESVRPGYHKLKFVLVGDRRERREKFIDVFFNSQPLPADDIATKKKKINLRTMAAVFNDFIDLAIHEPHNFKKSWKKERRETIAKLDPFQKYLLWDVLDQLSSQID